MTPQQIQDEIIESFLLFDDWLDRYQYLIDLGKQLPPLPESLRRDEHLLDGCQSRVWIVAEGDADALHFRAASDSAIVSGLIALLLKLYSGQPAAAILATPPRFIEAIGLKEHLSPTRSNGLAAMLAKINDEARARLSS